MTEEMLFDWMGCQNGHSCAYDDVKYVVNCESLETAQTVSEMIRDIVNGPRFNARDGDNRFWKYLWLFKVLDSDRRINAYSSTCNHEEIHQRFKNATMISGKEFISILMNGTLEPVNVDDLL